MKCRELKRTGTALLRCTETTGEEEEGGVGARQCSRIWKRRTESQETEKTTDVEFKDLRGST